MKKNINEIKAKILKGQKLTSKEKKQYILYSLTAGSPNGKMHDFTMITTSCLNNPLCEARRNNLELVCSKCYAAAQLEYQKGTREKFLINTLFYSNYELTKKDIPTIYTVNNVLRFESHGDVVNRTHAKNIYAIARKNDHLRCAVWSKNPWFFKGLQKPKNIIFVYSIAELNRIVTPETLKQVQRKYPFVDKIFAVYDEKTIADHSLTVNCGGRDCMACLTCYKTRKQKNIVIEKLK